MKLYTEIVDLPLSKFIECTVNGNLYALIIEGEADKEVLEAAWNSIVNQFNAEIGDEETELYTLLFKELTLLKIDYTIVSDLVPLLEHVYVKKFADEVNSILDTSFEFDWNNQEKYRHELQRCINRSKAVKIQLELKQKEFESIEQKNTNKQEKPTKQYFISVLINLSNHAKYQLSESITVFEFCKRIADLNQYLKSLEKLTPR